MRLPHKRRTKPSEPPELEERTEQLAHGEVYVRRIGSGLVLSYYPLDDEDPDWPGFVLDQESGGLPPGGIDETLAWARSQGWGKSGS